MLLEKMACGMSILMLPRRRLEPLKPALPNSVRYNKQHFNHDTTDMIRSNVTNVEMSTFREYFLFCLFICLIYCFVYSSIHLPPNELFYLVIIGHTHVVKISNKKNSEKEVLKFKK